MITRSEVELHIKCFSEGVEKVGDEFRAAVGSDMFRNTMFGEHVHNEQHCKVFGSAVNGCWNEYALLGELVSNHQDIGRVSMKSIEMEFHGRSGIGSCFSKP